MLDLRPNDGKKTLCRIIFNNFHQTIEKRENMEEIKDEKTKTSL